MADNADRIQEAADALCNLESFQEPAVQGSQAAVVLLDSDDRPAGRTRLGRVSPRSRAAGPFLALKPAAWKRVLAAVSPRTILKTLKRLRSERIQRRQSRPSAPPPPLTTLQRMQRRRQIELRRTAIPPLATMGLAMLVLGCWSVAVLAMDTDFFHPGTDVSVNTTYLATLALLAWPVAIVLLIGAGLFMYEVYSWFSLYPSEARR